VLSSRLLKALRKGGLTYLFRDRFVTDDANPLVTPRVAEPGPGSMPVSDGSSRLSVSGGKLQIGGSTGTWWGLGDSGVRLTHQAGLAYFVDIEASAWDIFILALFDATNANDIVKGKFFTLGGTVYETVAGSAALASLSTGVTYQIGVINRNVGAFTVVKGGAFTDWTLLWVVNQNDGHFVGSRQHYTEVSGRYVGTLDNYRVLNLRGSWASDNGIATNVLTNPASPTTTSQTANALIDLTFTHSNAFSMSVLTRRTDDNNCWRIFADHTTGTLILQEVNGGVYTSRISTAAAALTNGVSYRVVVVQDGNTYRMVLANALVGTYTDTGNFNTTATSVKKAAGTVTQLITWPRTVSLPAGV
jgi:hypothetical protein